ncbi:alpha/beta-hydrolase [Gonapodya prolifera JEL478]|uniref:Alpha/beta-hydrolase n=1 Tax=Gonapodya prolifera (strain JEL478) TaxID=1344416 RepID=A0A139ADX3_GONPJ|nr:alpha/beta-hydrolase [Gonapodya prolifera JEL478]|eukprot:KXS15026.1 alpha/beta-hydrolase [Gonapodya prolifera JEL478]
MAETRSSNATAGTAESTPKPPETVVLSAASAAPEASRTPSRITRALSLITLDRVRHTAGALFRYFTVGPPLQGWSLMETIILGEMRRFTGSGEKAKYPSTTELAKQRQAMDRVARPNPPQVVFSEVMFPRRPDLFAPRNETPSALSPWVSCDVVEWTYSETDKGKNTKERSIMFYIHGGAWILGSPKTHRYLLRAIAKRSGCRVVAIDYALAPENPYPAGLIDVISTYLYLTSQLPTPTPGTGAEHPTQSPPTTLRLAPSNVVVGGDSAGGNLTMCLLSWLRDSGYTQPAGAVLISPATELTFSNPDYQLNRFDFLPWAPFKIVGPEQGGATGELPPGPTKAASEKQDSNGSVGHSEATNDDQPARQLEESEPEEEQSHLYCKNHEIFTPYISPLLHSTCNAYPPVLVQVGEAERLWGQGLGAALKIASTPTASGVQFESYKNQVHVFQMLAGIHRRHLGHAALDRVGAFITSIIQRPATAGGTTSGTGAKLVPKKIPSRFFEIDLTETAREVGDKYYREKLGAMCAKVRKYKGQKDPEKERGILTRDRAVLRAPYIWEGLRLDWYEKAAKGGSIQARL